MKILISSESYWPNKDGGAIFEHRLVHDLIKDGHEVAVLVPGSRWRSYIEEDGKSLIYRVASVPLLFNRDGYRISYYARAQVQRALDEFRPDIIHINTMALTGISLARHAKKRTIPMIATNHLMPENVLMSLGQLQHVRLVKKLFWKIIVRFHEQFALVTSPTQTAVNLLHKYGLRRPLETVSNGIDTERYRPTTTKKSLTTIKKYGIGAHGYILYLGRVNAEKRLDLLLDSFAITLKSIPEAHLVIAGKGNRLDALRDYAKAKDIAKNVTFTGLVSDEEKLNLYQQAKMYAISSPAELQSITTLEAMACALPIVAVDKIALKELCHDQENGYLVPFGDKKAFAIALESLWKNQILAGEYGKKSREIVLKHHSSDSTKRAFERIYERVVSSKGLLE